MKKKSKKQKRGFTLVELLATLAVLSLVVTIAVFTTSSVITDAREKSYQATINNVVVAGGSYAVENPELSGWNVKTSDCLGGGTCEYQCISVNELIANGYFKGDILESEVEKNVTLTASDFIYVERDFDTKTVSHKIFEYSNTVDKKCVGNASAYGGIEFRVTPSNWAREKKVTIIYTLNSNQNIDDVTAEYTYDGVNGGDKSESGLSFPSSRVKTVEFDITENGELTAKIGTFEKKLYITTIDRNAPVVEFKSNNEVVNNQRVSITLKDTASGVSGYYFGKDNPDTNAVRYEDVANLKEVKLTKEVDSPGTWYLKVVDAAGNYSTKKTLEFFETEFDLGEGNLVTSVPGRLLDVSSKEYNLSSVSVNVVPYYTFKGWFNGKNCTGTQYSKVTTDANRTLYACVIQNVFTGSVTISGSTETGGKLLTNTSNIKASNHSDAINYSYQWYSNTSNSNSGGTKISGATSKNYTIDSSMVGKYIYVVVTVSRTNYPTRTFTSNVVGPIIAKKVEPAPTPTKKNNPITITGVNTTYTGKLITLVNVSGGVGTVYYSTTNSLTSSNYSSKGATAKPSKKDAGTYTVYWYLKSNNNEYKDNSGSVTATIKSKNGYVEIDGTDFNPVSYADGGGLSFYDHIKFGFKSHGGSHTTKVECNNGCDVESELSGGYFHVKKLQQNDNYNLKITVTSAATKSHTSASTEFYMVRFGYYWRSATLNPATWGDERRNDSWSTDAIDSKKTELEKTYNKCYKVEEIHWNHMFVNATKTGFIYCVGKK